MIIKNFRLHYKLGREREMGLIFSVHEGRSLLQMQRMILLLETKKSLFIKLAKLSLQFYFLNREVVNLDLFIHD